MCSLKYILNWAGPFQAFVILRPIDISCVVERLSPSCYYPETNNGKHRLKIFQTLAKVQYNISFIDNILHLRFKKMLHLHYHTLLYFIKETIIILCNGKYLNENRN